MVEERESQATVMAALGSNHNICMMNHTASKSAVMLLTLKPFYPHGVLFALREEHRS